MQRSRIARSAPSGPAIVASTCRPMVFISPRRRSTSRRKSPYIALSVSVLGAGPAVNERSAAGRICGLGGVDSRSGDSGVASGVRGESGGVECSSWTMGCRGGVGALIGRPSGGLGCRVGGIGCYGNTRRKSFRRRQSHALLPRRREGADRTKGATSRRHLAANAASARTGKVLNSVNSSRAVWSMCYLEC